MNRPNIMFLCDCLVINFTLVLSNENQSYEKLTSFFLKSCNKNRSLGSLLLICQLKDMIEKNVFKRTNLMSQIMQ